jgi:RecB family exonuclease
MDSPARFYHRSFEVDALAVARTLLGWRDIWYLAGWDGTNQTAASGRLQDIAEVETLAKGKVAPSTGERLQTVVRSLSSRKTGIKAVQLVDDKKYMPHMWQMVLDHFNIEAVEVDRRLPVAAYSSDLHTLQKILMSLREPDRRGRKLEPVKLKGDGSVLVLRSRSQAISARLIAEYVKSAGETGQPALVAGSRGNLLDEAFKSTDYPICGFDYQSRFRPEIQILPMALRMLWKPIDPNLLLQFLAHPVGPLPKRIRYPLAQVVAESPGLGGRPWKKALNKIFEAEETERGANSDEIDTLRDRVTFWLNPERFETDQGIPVEVAANRCKEVADWLNAMRHTGKDSFHREAFDVACSQALDVQQALKALLLNKMQKIDHEQLERLIRQAIGNGAGLPGVLAECGSALASMDPASFISRHDEVMWWDFSAPNLPAAYPWTRVELTRLQEQGVALQPVELLNEHLVKTWSRPVASASKRMIFVLHETDEEHHPLWDSICACVHGWKELDVEVLLQKSRKFPELNLKTTIVNHVPLVSYNRWWRIKDPSLLGPRETESYSSLNSFIQSPYQWVLRYRAKLRPGKLVEMAAGNQLKGRLIHRLIEDFINDCTNWQGMGDKAVRQWVLDRLPHLIEEEGAVLLGAGRTAEREAFIETAWRAVLQLTHHLKEASVNAVSMEHFDQAGFFGGDLMGYMDMLLRDKKGRETVVDIKWGGMRYRAEDLKANRHLQLAVYAYLRKRNHESHRWPAQAYFIIDDACMLAQKNDVFPSAMVSPSASGESVAGLWGRFETTWRWRRAQVDRGIVEVTVAGTDPDKDSAPPDDGLPMESDADRFNDFAVLTGWGEDA